MSMLKDCLTGIDGESYDILRVLTLVAVVQGLALEAWVVLHNGQPFDMQQFGIGMGAVFAAAGVALKLKADTEPGQKG